MTYQHKHNQCSKPIPRTMSHDYCSTSERASEKIMNYKNLLLREKRGMKKKDEILGKEKFVEKEEEKNK